MSAPSFPTLNRDFQTNTSFIYYRDGSRLGSFSVQNRQSIPYETMPKTLRDAVVSAENRTFWSDPGISVKGMTRAAWAIARGGEMQGGSTITQQYIKVLYLSQERTMGRKFKELLLAVKTGKEVSKKDILAGYLNTIYFGRGAYGVQAAARAFFYTDASKLTLSQSAVLAAVLNSPSNFDPSGGVGARERLLPAIPVRSRRNAGGRQYHPGSARRGLSAAAEIPEGPRLQPMGGNRRLTS